METRNKISIDQDSLVDLAIYAWRLEAWLEDEPSAGSTAVPRYVLRGLNKLLDQCSVSSLDMTGSQFDSGLALEVVDSVELDSVPPGLSMIGETVAPIVNIDGKVARHGQVVLHVGPEKR